MLEKDLEVWLCWCSCGLVRGSVVGCGLWGFRSPSQTQSVSLFLLRVDLHVELPDTSPAHAFLCPAMLPNTMKMDQTSEPIRKPQLNIFFYKNCRGLVSLYNSRTLARTGCSERMRLCRCLSLCYSMTWVEAEFSKLFLLYVLDLTFLQYP